MSIDPHMGYENVTGDLQGVADAWTDPSVSEIVERRGIQRVCYEDMANGRIDNR